MHARRSTWASWPGSRATPCWRPRRPRGIEVVEDAFAIERLFAADEVFTSSSVREVMPVVTLDERTVGDGAPGPVARDMQSALRAET